MAAGFFQLTQEGDLGLRVHRARGLVHQQDLRLRHQAACQRDELALPATEQRTALAHRQVPALRMRCGHAVQPGEAGGFDHACRVGGCAVEQHVVAQAAAEQARLLADVADARTKVRRVDLAQVDAVDVDLPAARLIQAGEQPQHRALARADAPEDGDAFTRLEAQRHALEHGRARLAVVRRVGKADIEQGDAPAEFAARHVGAADVALDGLLHHAVERAHRGARALVARGELHDAGDRRHGAAGEHHRADERAAGDDLVVDEVDAPHEHDQGDELLRHGREVLRPCRDAPRAQHRCRRRCRAVFVLAQEAALRAGGLDVLDAVDRLDEHAVQVGLLLQVARHRAAQRALDDGGQQHQDRQGDHQHPAQRPADDEGHGHEDDDERQVRQSRQRGRGKELAHDFDLPQRVGIGARRSGAMLHAHSQRLAKKHGADDEVALAPGQVDEIGAQLARREVEHQGQCACAGQCPQRDEGLMRDDLVEDHRGDEARHQHQQVRQHRGEQSRAVVGNEAAQRAPQPVRGGVAQQGVVARCSGLDARCGDQGNAAVGAAQFILGSVHRVVLAAGHDDAVARGRAGLVVTRCDDAGVAVLE